MWTRRAVTVYGTAIAILLLILFWIPVQHFVAGDEKRQQDVLAKDPNNCAALMKLGEDKYNLFNGDAAIKDFTRVVELEPEHVMAYRKRADAYDLIKRPDLAKLDRLMADKLEH